MNKKGNFTNSPTIKKVSVVKDSYIYKVFKRVLSITTTLLMIALLGLGGMMFYYNMKGKAAKEAGLTYNAPFGLYTIISGSMEPNIHVYDVVMAVQVDDLSKIKVGDVITFISTWDVNYGTTVTHRVVNITNGENGAYKFYTKGDNNASADGAVVTNENLIGRVVFKFPQLGKLQFFLATKLGWFIVVFVPALGVIVWDVIRIFKLKVLQVDVEDIKSTEEADKIYFEDEWLESQYLDDLDLVDTKISMKPVKEETNRNPIKKRESIDLKDHSSKVKKIMVDEDIAEIPMFSEEERAEIPILKEEEIPVFDRDEEMAEMPNMKVEETIEMPIFKTEEDSTQTEEVKEESKEGASIKGNLHRKNRLRR